MPMPRKPIEVHELTGNLKKNPARYADRMNEPRPVEPIGDAPKHLPLSEKKIWKEIVSLAPPGSLGNSDRLMLEITCRLVVAFRTGQLIKSTETSLLINALGRLGLTPADRAKLNVKQPSKPDKPVELDPLDFLM